MKKHFILHGFNRLLIVVEGFLGKDMYLRRRRLWEIVFRGNPWDLHSAGWQKE